MITGQLSELRELVARHVRDVPDFPQPGVLFKDIAPLVADPEAFHTIVDHYGQVVRRLDADVVVGIEARGFILGAPVAYLTGARFVPVRKAGKLPGRTLRQEYALEYGTAAIEIQDDALVENERVLVMDDILATGGTASAAAALVEKVGATVVGSTFLMELGFLNGRRLLGERWFEVLLTV